MNPIWCIKGLDPHQDTPVEILHVVLLGFVKYLWWDLVQLQLKNKDPQKNLLTTRLSSLDVSGLGISPLSGRTLVQYSGSLTGRDFWAIAQVAPFVVYDLVSKALSKLVPLIWHPKIQDIESHIALLEQEIQHFLLCVARWTNHWFNKPKFHIFVHLPAHIHRFGPAILFATEAFESFNAIICAKTHAFAQGNHIHHLLSGGLFLLHSQPTDKHTSTGTSESTEQKKYLFSHEQNHWQSAGTGPVALVAGRSTVTHYLGLDKSKHRLLHAGLFRTNKLLYLHNGDTCEPENFVIVRHPNLPGQTFVGWVEEIIQQMGSIAAFASQPNGILLQEATINLNCTRYGMPSKVLSGWWSMHATQDLLCTVNVQHNCIDNRCGPTGSQPMYQERVRTNQTCVHVVHSQNIHNLFLNTAQMQDTAHVQMFPEGLQNYEAEF
ncbi:hypothetical protein B0H10DRAFT_2167820 [Mycena sp. CBHHK59/15]|nr:hypothetical protein B0H10DRAFT_2167820 [Mycena sp. CBHHK59/15]